MNTLPFRLARRELRGGLRGFRIFLACLAIGVGAIAAAGSLTASMDEALRQDAQALLGGDIEFVMTHRSVNEDESAWLSQQGLRSDQTSMRTMGAAPSRRSLVELKGVDENYPLYGELKLTRGMTRDTALAQQDGVWGAAVEPVLMERLELAYGDRIKIGDIEYEIRAAIEHEPDRVANFVGFGPRVMVAMGSLDDTGLIQQGSLVRHSTMLKLSSREAALELKDRAGEIFPDAGWRVRDTSSAAAGVRRFLDNLTAFLTLVGLTSLLVGGIGVANAVKAFVDGRVKTIAVMKTVGASARLIFATYFSQIAVLALLGIGIGLVAGAALPNAAILAFGDKLPLDARLGIYPAPLGMAALFGALSALAFALWPLGRAQEIPAAALFRDMVSPAKTKFRKGIVLGIAASGLALSGLAIWGAERPVLAASFVASSLAALMMFRAAGSGVMKLAKKASLARGTTSGNPRIRLALSNLHRPGAPTGTVVLSLGLGLTVLVCIALIEGNLSRQIQQQLPDEAPSFFFIDVQNTQAEEFRQIIEGVEGTKDLKMSTFIRGRITHLEGVPIDEAEYSPDVAWAVRGDRSFSSAATSGDQKLLAGEWWPEDYAGPPLVSVTSDPAIGLGLEVGDTVTVNILGREITAEVASIRKEDWSNLSMNFAFVLSPNALEGAPVTWIASVKSPRGSEAEIDRAVADFGPNITAIPVREALERAAQVIADIGVAIRAAAGLSLVSGALVLAGAVAATHRRRIYDAVVLKVVGATRSDLWRAFLLEYGLMGAATGIIAGVLGSAASWAVLTFVMDVDWVFLPGLAAITIIACVIGTMVIGFAGIWAALGAKAAPFLRND